MSSKIVVLFSELHRAISVTVAGQGGSDPLEDVVVPTISGLEDAIWIESLRSRVSFGGDSKDVDWIAGGAESSTVGRQISPILAAATAVATSSEQKSRQIVWQLRITDKKAGDGGINQASPSRFEVQIGTVVPEWPEEARCDDKTQR